ncbi:hypothetical protein QSJ18_17795 [Gordonia sp. ABSL1-1]|uniref:DUF6779 domain-containing protein n=1 Tax=Gordonia sp. ABSL1-1 TaxID=3053923 RepID=UPI00257309B7|nr:DUF6779 domain-containing protein [Gordonia sp. ABSL1-1]MDL9938603.1 hypothetical protein [Gordonia sp. ABSL1-1]
MTTSGGRSAETRRSGRSAGQWLLGLLIVLALAASILMVFTDDLSMTASLAVIAALWAAVIGAILVTKFRRQAESAEAKSRDLRLVYELQLEREIAARRQYELDVETTIRKEVAQEGNEELAELKAQVLALRSSLEMLLGESLPEQRTALPNEKLRELASGLGGYAGAPGYGSGDYPGGYGSGFATADDGAVAARDFAATAPAADDGRHQESAVDPNELTEVIPIVTDDPMSGRIATEVPLSEVPTHPGPAGGFAAATPAAHADDSVSDAEIVETPAETATAAPNVDRPLFTDETPTDEWERRAVIEAVAAADAAENSAADAAGTSAADAAGTSAADAAGTSAADAAETSAADAAETSAADAGEPVVDAQIVTPEPVTPEPVGPESGSTETAGAEPSAATAAASTPEDVSDQAGEQAVADAGRHEGGSGQVAGSGRRRRRGDADPDGTHSSGLPVSELLDQLRQADAAGGGRRRRAD